MKTKQKYATMNAHKHASYLTKGKEYEILLEESGGFVIDGDNGIGNVSCLYKGCSHLHGGSWTIIEKIMKTKELKIADAYDYLIKHEYLRTGEVLKRFMEATVLDLLQTNLMNVVTEFTTVEQDFYDAGCVEELDDQDCAFTLTDATILLMRYVAKCEFTYESVDETEVGLGSKGQVSGIENSWFEVVSLTYITADGSEIDLTGAGEIRDYLYRNINIEN